MAVFRIVQLAIMVTFAAVLIDGSADAQGVNFKMGMATGPGSPQNEAAERFVELMHERSGGAIQGKVFHSGSLGDTRQLLQSMVLGDVHATVTVALSSFVPKSGVFLLPYLFNSQEHFYKAVDDPSLVEAALGDAPSKGLRVISIWDSGFRQIWTTDLPVREFDDLQGLKIRVPGAKIWVATFKAFDVNATPMAYGEVYTSLQQGVIDGMEQPIPNFYSNKFFEVAKYMAKVDYMAGPAFLVVSERWWQSLTPEQQEIAVAAANEAKELERRLNQEAEQANIEEMKEKGLQITEPNLAPFREAGQTVWLEFEDDYGKELIERLHAAD